MRKVNKIDYIISERLKTARLDCKMSLKDAAETISITYQQIQKYENGKNRISASRLWQFAKLYNIPIQDFFV